MTTEHGGSAGGGHGADGGQPVQDHHDGASHHHHHQASRPSLVLHSPQGLSIDNARNILGFDASLATVTGPPPSPLSGSHRWMAPKVLNVEFCQY